MTAAKVCAFDSLLKNECGGLVRVELADVSTVPLLVNIYHPTVEGYNLGSAFYRKEVHPEHEAARVRRWQQRCARIWSSLELFPKGAIDLYVACAYLQENDDEKIAYRVIISKIDAVSVEIRAADHGWKRSLPLEKCYAGSLRILSRQYSHAPLVRFIFTHLHTRFIVFEQMKRRLAMLKLEISWIYYCLS
ncbi:unnamed protein product [Anisakis simplex]|uniref:Uncharacterized protein n=1 Tax=Anisakis simplex TaxID=6269 RepID=A0A3P6S6Q7_ANISI|nr:unnamed protein product [Anisakis simplex]